MLQICMMSLPFQSFLSRQKKISLFKEKLCLRAGSRSASSAQAGFEAAVGLSLCRFCRLILEADLQEQAGRRLAI